MQPDPTDAIATLGTIIDSNFKRDAIHIAVYPAEVGARYLVSGCPVKLINGKLAEAHGDEETIGILDPFLFDGAMQGEWAWVMVKPRTIQSLRHIWEHPDFPASLEVAGDTQLMKPTESQTLKAKALLGDPRALGWQTIEGMAMQLGEDPHDLITNARQYIKSGSYWSKSHFEGESINPRTFWPAFTAFTGEEVPSHVKTESFLTCSC